MLKIGIISSDNRVSTALEEFIDKQTGTTLAPVTTDEDYSSFQVLVLVEPYCIKARYCSMLPVWKAYLAHHSPQTILVVAGFHAHENAHNYLNLLAPWDWGKWQQIISEARPITSNWELETSLAAGENILTLIRPFFKGHNNDSIIDCITNVRIMLDSARIHYYGDEELQKAKHPFSAIWRDILVQGTDSVLLLCNRWESYVAYFKVLPFWSELLRINVEQFLQDLKELVRGKTKLSVSQLAEKEQFYRDRRFFMRLGTFDETIKRINQTYINREINGEILLIDDDENWHQQLKDLLSNFIITSVYREEEISGALASCSPDLVLLDLDLGEEEDKKLRGVDVLPMLVQALPETPIVIASSYQKPSIIKRTIDAGAVYYFAKSAFDLLSWGKVLLKLISGKRYALEQIEAYQSVTNGVSIHRAKILVIEDQQDWVKKNILNLTNRYDFELAANTVEALDLIKLKGDSYDLLLLDLYLGKKNGILQNDGIGLIDEAAKYLPHTPIVVMTGSFKDSDKRTVLEKKNVLWFLPKSQYDAKLWLKALKNAVIHKMLNDRFDA